MSSLPPLPLPADPADWHPGCVFRRERFGLTWAGWGQVSHLFGSVSVTFFKNRKKTLAICQTL